MEDNEKGFYNESSLFPFWATALVSSKKPPYDTYVQ